DVSADSAGNSEILDYAQFILNSVLMRQVCDRVKILVTQRTNCFTVPTHLAGVRMGQSTNDSQKACFAAAVGSAEFDQLAGRYGEVQVFEQTPLSANASQVYHFQHIERSTIEIASNKRARQVIGSEWDDSRLYSACHGRVALRFQKDDRLEECSTHEFKG